VEYFLTLDAAELFAPKMSLPEVLVRGLLAYAGLMLLLRVLPKRQVSRTSMGDILFVVLVGGIAVEALVKTAASLPDFLLLLLTVMLLSYACDRLAFRYRGFRRLVQEPPTCLIRDGKVLKDNLRREMVTDEDLMRELRRQDIDDPARVKEAQLEADGEISVVKKPEGGARGRPATAPREECDDGACARPAGQPDRPSGWEPERNGWLGPEHLNGGRSERAERPTPEPPEDTGEEPELAAFLAAVEKLRARLHWHQEQVAKLKEALARHGVRYKPLTERRRDGPGPKEEHAVPSG
jgi:uncharacterized membrane protein YcaP (DUF421 family)